MASRCHLYEGIAPVEELYTYGSPRVGWRGYCNSLGVTHHRWVNNNDIVTRVPLKIMGYVHDGEEHYINAYGKLRQPTGWQRVKDRFRGIWFGLKQGKIDSFSDHSIGGYVKCIKEGKE
jgi:triacylglycerol lipase